MQYADLPPNRGNAPKDFYIAQHNTTALKTIEEGFLTDKLDQWLQTGSGIQRNINVVSFTLSGFI